MGSGCMACCYVFIKDYELLVIKVYSIFFQNNNLFGPNNKMSLSFFILIIFSVSLDYKKSCSTSPSPSRQYGSLDSTNRKDKTIYKWSVLKVMFSPAILNLTCPTLVTEPGGLGQATAAQGHPDLSADALLALQTAVPTRRKTTIVPYHRFLSDIIVDTCGNFVHVFCTVSLSLTCSNCTP